MKKIVLLSQLHANDFAAWQQLLASHDVAILEVPPRTDVIDLLENLQQQQQALPHLLLLDIEMKRVNGSSLVAMSVLRWLVERKQTIPVLLTSSRHRIIPESQHLWITRLGAADLLPRLTQGNASEFSEKLGRILRANHPEPSPRGQAKKNIGSVAERHSPAKRLRQAASEDIARKIAMIPLAVMQANQSDPGLSEETEITFSLDATLAELSASHITLDITATGKEARQIFEANPSVPGIILLQGQAYFGMLSRRRFLEVLSRPYGLELFLKRPITVLYEQCQVPVLKLQGNMSIVMAAQMCLQRDEPALLYEPVVVEIASSQYQLLDVHELLQAQAKIHELATQLLRQQTQSHLIQAEKMVTLGQVVAEVCHDIRSPVGMIHSNTEYLSTYINGLLNLICAYEEATPEGSPTIRKLADQLDLDFVKGDLPKVLASIQSGAKHLRRLVDGLQTFSRMEEVDTPRLVNFHECLDSSLLILANRTRNMQIHKHYGELPDIEGYSGQLIQVCMNLLGNAVDALLEKNLEKENDSDDPMTYLSDRPWEPQIWITTTTHQVDGKAWIRVQIADNGKGIPAQLQSRIFETFFTTKGAGEGTGLGLTICHQIITQNHRGHLALHSPYFSQWTGAMEQGTEFEILLPVAQVAPKSKSAPKLGQVAGVG
jgi:two-component system NtrC family sensor kinase